MSGQWGKLALDDWSPEAREAAAKARASGGGSSANAKTVSHSEASAKVKGATSERLRAALNHPNTHPDVKKLINQELDSRADRNRAPPSEKEARMLGITR